MDPSRRVRRDSLRRDRSPRIMIRDYLLQTDHTVPLRDGSGFACIPGNELPGYDHSVPTGQRRVSPTRPFAVSHIRGHWTKAHAPLALQPNLLFLQHRLQTPENDSEGFAIIFDARLRLLATPDTIDEMFEQR